MTKPIRLLLSLTPFLLLQFVFAQNSVQPTDCSVSVPIMSMEGDSPAIPRLDRLQVSAGPTRLQVEKLIFPPPSMRVLVVVDMSQSQTSRFSKPLLRKAVDRLVELVPRQLGLGVLFFDETVEAKAEFQQDRNLVSQVIADQFAKPWRKKTALYDALQSSIELFRETRRGDTIVLFTDGEDNGSKSRFKQVADRIKVSRIRLFTAYFPLTWSPDLIAPPRHSPQSQELAGLASWTGGLSISPDFNDRSGAGFLRGVDLMGLLIGNTAYLHLRMPAKSANSKLKVVTRGEHMRWFYPETLPACAQPAP